MSCKEPWPQAPADEEPNEDSDEEEEEEEEEELAQPMEVDSDWTIIER